MLCVTRWLGSIPKRCSMNPQIADLAALMRMKRSADEKFVLMLGAGASMSSGVPSTPVIMEELLKSYGTAIPAGPVESRFNKLWSSVTGDVRSSFLKSYLDMSPSPGYARLADLMKAGYFDVVITFNFDQLLERALRGCDLDYQTIIRGETRDEEMLKLIKGRVPRIRVAKLHGSLNSADHFLFATSEMHKYPDAIKTMLLEITGRDVMICGYAFQDNCVINAFAEAGGALVNVNPTGLPDKLQYYADRRPTHAINERFDAFFEELHGQLLPPPPPGPVDNPFKFLESYEFEDAELLVGRTDELNEIEEDLTAPAPSDIIVISGPARAGKTSLAKAGMIPIIGRHQQRPVYLRCRADLLVSMPRDIAAVLTEPGKPNVKPAPDIASALRELVAATEGRVVVILDQFDRILSQHDMVSQPGRARLKAFLQEQFFSARDPRLTVVFVVIDDEHSGGGQLFAMCQKHARSYLLQCLPFTRNNVMEIIRGLAARASVEFDPFIVSDLARRFEETRLLASDKRFTLAHVQAVCHLLVSSPGSDINTYREFERNIEALNQAINVCDMISFVEDFAWSDAEQLRNLIKVPLLKSKDQIAQFVKVHYEELLARAAAQRRRPPSSNGRT